MKFLTILAFSLVLMALLMHETEARRKVLKGRKTVTRTYYKEPAIPAWAIILLVAIGELIIGVIIYFVMRSRILKRTITGSYAIESSPINSYKS